jgi:hypothetical protein
MMVYLPPHGRRRWQIPTSGAPAATSRKVPINATAEELLSTGA